MTAIDHRYFPHLIDLIWSHMPYPSWRVARRVCKAWEERAGRMLNHFVLTHEKDPETGSFFTMRCRDLSSASPPQGLFFTCKHWDWLVEYEGYRERKDRRYLDEMLEGWSASDWEHHGDLYSLYTELIGTNLQERRWIVVDLVGFDVDLSRHHTTFYEMNEFLFHCMCCFTVRWYGGSNPWLGNAPNEVNKEDHVDLMFFDLTSNSTEVPLVLPAAFNDRWDNVLVINYACFTDPTAIPAEHLTIDLWDTIDSVFKLVLILHNNIPADERRPPSLEPSLILAYGTLLEALWEVRVVGLDEFLSPKELESYVAHIRGLLEEQREHWKGMLSKQREPLTFCTHEEYRAEVGEREYRIHTVR